MHLWMCKAKYIIKKMCFGSLNKNLATLIYVADRYKNREMCDKEVKKGPWPLRDVFNKFNTLLSKNVCIHTLCTLCQTTLSVFKQTMTWLYVLSLLYQHPLELTLSNQGHIYIYIPAKRRALATTQKYVSNQLCFWKNNPEVTLSIF